MSKTEVEPSTAPTATTDPNTAAPSSIEQIEREMLELKKDMEKQTEVAPVETDEGSQPTNAEPKTDAPEAKAYGKPEAETETKSETSANVDDPVRLKAEVERLRGEIRSRDGRYGHDKQLWTAKQEALEQQIQDILGRLPANESSTKSANTESMANPPLPQETPAAPTDEQLKDAFGEDFEDSMGRSFASKLWISQERRIAAERNRVEQLVGQHIQSQKEQSQAQTRLEQAWNVVEQAVPGALDLNANAQVNGFADYLQGRYGDTGIQRRTMAEMAIQAIQSGATAEDYEAHTNTLVQIVGGFAGANGSTNAGHATKPPAKSSKPDPRLYLTPKSSSVDHSPSAESITKAQVDQMLQDAGKTGKVDEAVAFIREKAAKGLIV